LNEGARDQWPEGDVRHEESVQHYLGIGAEWWFNSSSYQ
jgi:maltoporin